VPHSVRQAIKYVQEGVPLGAAFDVSSLSGLPWHGIRLSGGPYEAKAHEQARGQPVPESGAEPGGLGCEDCEQRRLQSRPTLCLRRSQAGFVENPRKSRAGPVCWSFNGGSAPGLHTRRGTVDSALHSPYTPRLLPGASVGQMRAVLHRVHQGWGEADCPVPHSRATEAALRAARDIVSGAGSEGEMQWLLFAWES